MTAPWIQTFTGRQVFLLEPRPEDVDIRDIAHALSMLCRFTGHVSRFYSVAEHSWRMSYLVPKKYALHALLHDAQEAYVGDVSTPLKRALRYNFGVEYEWRSFYDMIEHAHWRAVARRFQLPIELPPEIKLWDKRMMVAEHQALMGVPPAQWGYDDVEPAANMDGFTLGMSPLTIELLFLDRFNEVTA